ncbi:hypothetical protein EYC80_006978 [Monilinia laxa]|uniref:Uncharacterized protein n=1 Tax=Monilinia laxa TaxID=61186 RepID=A0A5N6JZR7_MONLA|nr:hypothetical protein EYC80_006978 [Monilinia laxa]
MISSYHNHHLTLSAALSGSALSNDSRTISILASAYCSTGLVVAEYHTHTHTPYTIHHTPYTIHHTPYTIHHTPYTIHHTHHTPYTIHHTPYTIHHTPYHIVTHLQNNASKMS